MNKKKTNDEFLKELKEKGRTDIEPLEEYIDNKTKIWFKCLKDENHPNWKTTPSTILKGCGCPTCSSSVITENIYLKRIDDMGIKMKLVTDFKGL